MSKIKLVMIAIGATIGLAFLFLVFMWLWGHINWTKVDPLINKLKNLHKNGGKVFFGTFFIALVAYLILTVRQFYKNPEDYSDKIWGKRKTLYVLFLSLVAVGIIVGYIDFKDWKLLTQLTAFVVFIDLAVFQTPSITKIWNAEFHHRVKIEKTIEVNVEFIDSTTTKIEVISDAIKQTANHFAPKNEIAHTWNAYRKELRQYLSLYTNRFRFRIDLFPFKIEADDSKTKLNIENALKSIETYHSYKIASVQGGSGEPTIRNQLAEKLYNGESSILDPGKLIVIPIFEGKSHLIALKSGDGTKVDEIDVSHIVNLTRIFNWYMPM
jgi:hypothetical protein